MQGLRAGGQSALADGQWHRMHPLTPLMRGGLVLLIVFGLIVTNLRDRILDGFVHVFAGDRVRFRSDDDPIEWVLANDLVLVAALVVLAVLAICIAGFFVVWRFSQFRVSQASVETRRGILFRTNRRAPLDRVQSVNLTRPFPARLFGLAKLEVVGAGSDANVPLEFLATDTAEHVRRDILTLASGGRDADGVATDGSSAGMVGVVREGVGGLISGVDADDIPPESILRIPPWRVIASALLQVVVPIAFVVVGIGIVLGLGAAGVFGSARGPMTLVGLGAVGVALVSLLPAAVIVVGVAIGQVLKFLRFAIAPTPDGVRVTFGLLTTVTETLPPGRVFALEVVQPLTWRPFGWWLVRINRMTGKSALEDSKNAARSLILPVGTRSDVDRVLGMFLPHIPHADAELLWGDGLLGPRDGDPFTVMPPRARWRRPVSGSRHGYVMTTYALLLRRGRLSRKLAIFPFARMQGMSLKQGPIDRAQRVAAPRAHTIAGQINGILSGIDRDDALELLHRARTEMVVAARDDRTHRWRAGPVSAGPASPEVSSSEDAKPDA